MKKSFFNITYIFISAVFVFNSLTITFAWEEPSVEAAAAIMIEETTGKILYSKDADKKMFPASTTKILTAIVALDYLSPDELIVVGREINSVPLGSSIAGHIAGETLRADNLIRGLIIPSGSDTACVIAIEVARRVSGDESISYANAEKLFCDLMNKKAVSLGATNSNFVNPHGLHDENHYTTARDMALISKEALKNPLIREIAKEKEFRGNGAGENPDPSLKTQQYNWKSRNELLLQKDFYYSYATGIKTGFTDEAGSCLTASAAKDGKQYISVVFFSTDAGRWSDTVKLFDYGFETFNNETIQEKGQVLGQIGIDNPRLGDAEKITAVSNDTFTSFMSKDELSWIVKEIKYNEELIAPATDTADFKLKTPISVNDVIGKVSYYLDGELLFTGDVISQDEALQRTFSTDTDYYFNKFKAAVFSVNAIPYWIGGIIIIIVLILIIKSANNRKARRSSILRKRY